MKYISGLIIFAFLNSTSVIAQTDSIVPVRVSSFGASINNSNTKLIWKTVCYLSYAKFHIQKSGNGTTYTTIDSITADQLRCRQPFEYLDNSVQSTGSIFYRINVGDIDGRLYHSKIIKVNFRKGPAEILSVYPTVINTSSTIVYSSAGAEAVIIRLINSSGVVVKQFNLRIDKGVNNYSLDFSGVANGKYWLSTAENNRSNETIGVIKL